MKLQCVQKILWKFEKSFENFHSWVESILRMSKYDKYEFTSQSLKDENNFKRNVVL